MAKSRDRQKMVVDEARKFAGVENRQIRFTGKAGQFTNKKFDRQPLSAEFLRTFWGSMAFSPANLTSGAVHRTRKCLETGRRAIGRRPVTGTGLASVRATTVEGPAAIMAHQVDGVQNRER